jgi:GT2 family glycosyltransferase
LGGVGGQGIEREINNIFDEWRKNHSAQNFGSSPKKDVPYLFGLCCSYPRDVFNKVGGFDPFFRINAGEDLDLGIRIRKLGYRLAYDPSLRVQHFHKDTRESLLRVQYNWSYWSYISKLRTNSSTFKFVLGPYWRLIRYSVEDIFKGRTHLLNLNYEVFRAKTKAIRDVHKKTRKENYKRQNHGK